jgi:uncharacterized protein YqgC (DUF456 family)
MAMTENDNQNSAGGEAWLWIGLLLPPIAWALQMQINYWMVRGACARGSSVRLLAVSLIALLLVGVAAFSAWLGRRRFRADPVARVGTLRKQFLGNLGLFSSGIFLLAIVAQAIGALIFQPCQL